MGMGMGLEPVEVRITAELDGGDLAAAATIALKAYGPGILGYLAAVVHDRNDAEEVFSCFSEDLWKGIPGFRGVSSVKTWAYRVAWHAAMRFLGSPHRRRIRRLRTSEASQIAAQMYTASSNRLAAEREDSLRELREQLSPEEQTLIILRLDRRMSWKQVAVVLSVDGQAPVDSEVLRKRFERLKLRLRELAREKGLIAARRQEK
jgi:RNA polymerase sigma-70 factor (ECF subfamily)